MDSLVDAAGPRLRVLKHLMTQNSQFEASKAVAAASVGDGNDFQDDDSRDPDRPQPLSPGEMQLYSYYGEFLMTANEEQKCAVADLASSGIARWTS